MLRVRGQMLRYGQMWPKLHNSKSYSKVVDQFHVPDETPEELELINRRLKLRKALRQEYLRKLTDPHSTDPYVFDPMLQRYYTVHMTGTERFIPTFKNWCIYMLTTIVPVVLLALYLKSGREKLERKYRSGEIEWKDRQFKI